MKAIVTGHSKGLGAAIAEQLLSRGVAVLGLARTANPQLGRRFPRLLDQLALDLADTAAVLRWLSGGGVERYLRGCEQVALINNAAAVEPIGPLGSNGAAVMAHAVALNVSTPLLLAEAVAIASAGARDRRILHVSSGAARSAVAGWGPYCAAKAALDQHARAVAAEGGSLRICSMAPGLVDTGMQAVIRACEPRRFALVEQFQAFKADGRLASPDACARRMVSHLLSESFGLLPVAHLAMPDEPGTER